MMHPSSIINLPPELLTLTFGYLASPADLLHVGLTCRALWESVRGRELPYRLIRTHGASDALWAHLATRKDLARNVRVLEVVPMCVPEVVPGIGEQSRITMTPVQGLENVCRALSNMPLLETFEWDFAVYPGRYTPRIATHGPTAPLPHLPSPPPSPIPRAVVQRCVLTAALRMNKQHLRNAYLYSVDTSQGCFIPMPTTPVLSSLALTLGTFSPSSFFQNHLRKLLDVYKHTLEALDVPAELGPVFSPAPLTTHMPSSPAWSTTPIPSSSSLSSGLMSSASSSAGSPPPSPSPSQQSERESERGCQPPSATLRLPALRELRVSLHSGGTVQRVRDPWLRFLDANRLGNEAREEKDKLRVLDWPFPVVQFPISFRDPVSGKTQWMTEPHAQPVGPAEQYERMMQAVKAMV